MNSVKKQAEAAGNMQILEDWKKQNPKPPPKKQSGSHFHH